MDATQGKKLRNVQVSASLKNVREQRLLDKELKHIDDLWHLELKSFTREKLEITQEYTKLEEDKKNVEYLKDRFQETESQDKKRVEHLKEYTENFRSEKDMQARENRNIERFDFKSHEKDKIKIHLEEVEKPTAILKEMGLSQCLPTIPDKPRLVRSNSTVGELIKAKSVSETNLASEFGTIQRDNKIKPAYLSLPDISYCGSKRPKKFGIKRDIISCTPGLEEIPEFATPKITTRKRILSLPYLGMERRSHTIL